MSQKEKEKEKEKDKEKPAKVPQTPGQWLWGWTKTIAVTITAWFILSSFVVQAFHIPSGSMERTLLIGDVLFVNKALYGAEIPFVHKHLPSVREPRRGEIVVFRSPIEDLTVVKRLVGLSGDTMAMVDGKLFRNGKPLDEPYVVRAPEESPTDPTTAGQMRQWQTPYFVGGDPARYRPDAHNWGPLVIPHDSLMMMGDNRDESFDSRFYGFVPRSNLKGSPLIIYFSYDPSSWRPLPFVTAIRWGRLLSRPR